MDEKTICAVATAAGEGGIAIVRCSGPAAREIFARAFRPAKPREILSHRMMYGHAVGEKGELLDEVMGVFFASPATYTREDMFEIQCHGGNICARRVLERLLSLGARMAGCGEFTKRAFLNGRIDLTRAEAVMALIGAGSAAAARASLRQLEGGVSAFVTDAARQLTGTLSIIEACIDFPEEVEEADAAARVREGLTGVLSSIERRVDERAARLIREGASIVLTGRPNVGKSSIMNALLARERAIVTAVPGTTRDVLTERLELGGISAELSDTAGLRDTEDEIERIGVDRAAAAVARADVVLCVLDASMPLTEEDRDILARRDERYILLLNKCDLPPRVSGIDPREIRVSAATGEGMEELLATLTQRVAAGEYIEGAMTARRHIELARAAAEALDRAIRAIDAGITLDVCAIDIKEALNDLCDITGENATEAVIDRVFSDFCVGK